MVKVHTSLPLNNLLHKHTFLQNRTTEALRLHADVKDFYKEWDPLLTKNHVKWQNLEPGKPFPSNIVFSPSNNAFVLH